MVLICLTIGCCSIFIARQILLEDTVETCNWLAHIAKPIICPVPLQIRGFLQVDTALNKIIISSAQERESTVSGRFCPCRPDSCSWFGSTRYKLQADYGGRDTDEFSEHIIALIILAEAANVARKQGECFMHRTQGHQAIT